MYALEVEQPKVVKGLSSMQFIVPQWKEIALCEDKNALIEYAKATFDTVRLKWRIKARYPKEAGS